MQLHYSTYRTFSGVKEVLEIPRKKPTQWIIYLDNQPKFYVDFFDLSNESNAMMNKFSFMWKKRY